VQQWFLLLSTLKKVIKSILYIYNTQIIILIHLFKFKKINNKFKVKFKILLKIKFVYLKKICK